MVLRNQNEVVKRAPSTPSHILHKLIVALDQYVMHRRHVTSSMLTSKGEVDLSSTLESQWN